MANETVGAPEPAGRPHMQINTETDPQSRGVEGDSGPWTICSTSSALVEANVSDMAMPWTGTFGVTLRVAPEEGEAANVTYSRVPRDAKRRWWPQLGTLWVSVALSPEQALDLAERLSECAARAVKQGAGDPAA